MDTLGGGQAKAEPKKPEEWQRIEEFSKRLLRVPISEVRVLEGDIRKQKKPEGKSGP